MAIKLKFSQGVVNEDPGVAIIATGGTPVTIAVDTPTAYNNFVFSLLDAPPGSALTPGVLSAGAASTIQITPDASIPETLPIRVVATNTNTGLVSSDTRDIIVPSARSWIYPGFGDAVATMNYKVATVPQILGWKRPLDFILRDLETIFTGATLNGTIISDGSFSNPTFTGIVNNNASNTIMGGNAKSKPASFTGNIATSTASASTANLQAAAVGELYAVDVLVAVNRGSPAAGTVAAWKLTGLFFGAAGPAATISGTVLSQAFGGGTGLFTAPNLITSGANIQLHVTSPDTTARTWSYEAHVLRALL